MAAQLNVMIVEDNDLLRKELGTPTPWAALL